MKARSPVPAGPTPKRGAKPSRKKAEAKTRPDVLEPEVLPAEKDKEEAQSVVVEEGVEVLPPEEAEELPADIADIEIDEAEPNEPAEKRSKLPERSGGLVRHDALSAYLREISKYPHLTREEESELALRYYKDKDLEAAYKLVSSNLWLVVKIARDYERAARSLLDLIQEGNIGLLEAVKNFDPFRGTRFPSYAVWWIKAYVIRYVMANWRLVKIGTTQAQRKLFFNLKKERDRLEREGFYPGPKLLAEKLNVKESEVVEMEQRLGSSDLSVDAPVQDDSESNLLSVLPAQGLNAEDIMLKKEMRDLLTQSFDDFSSTLNEKELIIFKERMLGEEKATLQEIADKLSISRERVRQIEQRLREKLKEFIEKRLGSAVTATDFD